MKKYLISLLIIFAFIRANSQTKYFPIPGAVEIPGSKINGTLDDLTDFSTRTQVPFTMPDGTKLMTDIYLPILQDSFVYNDTFQFNLLPAPFPPIKIPIYAVLLQKGSQFIIYDTINGVPNPNPYQLPMIWKELLIIKEAPLKVLQWRCWGMQELSRTCGAGIHHKVLIYHCIRIAGRNGRITTIHTFSILQVRQIRETEITTKTDTTRLSL